jgi:NAD(P)H dehydrogenase (quinone)
MILVTGASGQLGRAIVDSLQAADVPVIAGTQHPDGTARTRVVDFDDPDSLSFEGIDTLVLVSAGYAEDDVVIARHHHAVAAAERDGVGHIIYTSVATGGDHLAFALAHRSTERRIRASALQWTILRNGLYAELFGSLLAPDQDVITAPFGTGGLAAVSREDLAEAAANVARRPNDHAGRVYDLVGSRAVTAAQVADSLGLAYRPDTLGARREVLDEGGLLPFQPAMLLSIYSAVANGFLAQAGEDLGTLLGRMPTDPEPTIRELVRSAGQRQR